MGEAKKTKYQQFTVETIHRSQNLLFSDFDIMTIDGLSDLYEEPETVTMTKEETAAVKAERKAMREKSKDEQTPDFYFVVVCNSRAEKDAIFKACNLPLWEKTITLDELRRWAGK